MKIHSRPGRRAAGFVLLLVIWIMGCTHAPPPSMGVGPPPHIKPGAVIYGVVPPLFGRNPIADVTERLDYLRELGVDILLLSPINATDDPSSISYSTTRYFALRPDFGNPQDLRTLIREARKRGIKVMMDMVANHTSTAHPFYQDIKKHGRASAFYNYYDRDASGRITHYFDWVGLPNLNYDNPEVLSMMKQAFIYWPVIAEIEGYRVDAAWGIRQRTPQAWAPIIRELRRVDPGVIMVAEASARDPYYVRNGFDLAYDWTEELGKWAWQPVFDQIDQAGVLVHEAITRGQPAPQTVLRFLNNNDTAVRFITRYGPDITRVAAVLQHTVPGVPLVYTGDEVGAEYEPYEDPPPIAWEDHYGLRPLYRRLAELREALPALHSGDFIPLPPRDNPHAYAFLRNADRGNWALILINFGPAGPVTLNLQADTAGLLEGKELKDALSGVRLVPALNENGMPRFHLPAYAAMILLPES